MTDLVESVALASPPLSGKKWKIRIIEGDRKGSSAFYPKEVLERDQEKFAPRARIYMDHPTESDATERPERTARDLIGYVENGKYEGSDIYGEAAIFSDWQEWVKERAEAGVIGMSIRASGEVDESGTLKSFHKIHSVDLVTEAGAGGGFTSILEAARKEEISEQSVSESNKKEEKMELPKELAEALDAMVQGQKTLNENVSKLITAQEAADKKAADEAAALEESQKPTFADIDKALVEAELPAAARARVFSAVEDGKDLAESVKAEKDYMDSVLEEANKTVSKVHVSDEGKELSEAERTSNAAKSIFG